MSVWNILVKENAQDTFSLQTAADERIMDFSVGHQSGIVQSNARALLHQHSLVLSINAADLLDFAVAIYSVDQVVSRKAYGFQGWSRHIKVHFPVSDANLWTGIAGDIEQMLSFLSGDCWELYFRQRTTQVPVQTVLNQNPYGITKVSLLSGGLDSFISAVDLLASNEKPAFVSHYKRGSESPKQKRLYSILETKYGSGALSKYQFYVQPNQKHQNATKEDSSRARSFLFLVLGISVAHALGDGIDLIIPENGLISLNVPLTQTRLSSHSTRTTHPFYLASFKKIISALGINNQFRNPYQFQTKGEMMLGCLDRVFLQQHYTETLSCSHPDISRFVLGSRAGLHCGYCVPCIIRQAAEHAAGGVRTQYAHHIKTSPPNAATKKGRDLRAFKMAISEIQGLPYHSVMLRVLRSGPLPFNNQSDLNQYISLFKRGMHEVSNFLR
jgi:7-cyano-7-deazaguanine synthase in queuosine biosynthesis